LAGTAWTAIRTIDDQAVRRFEKHRCRCHRYSAQQAHYKADQAARVRRFVRFLEDQGYVEVDDGIDDLPRHLADYSDAIDRLQLAEGPAQAYRSEAEHFMAWLRITRRQWIDIDDTIIDQYAAHDCRCPVWRKRGKLVATGTKRRRRCARHFVEFLRGRGVIPSVEPVADDDPHMSAYLTWLKQHRGATDETIRRYRTDIRRLMPMLGEPSQWDAAGLRSAFQRRSKETPGSASLLVTIMRSYIRFLVVRGECRPALLHAVPSVQRYRLSTLPRHVDPATIERIIAACPTDRPVEVRDKAIILLLARLGLRAADVQDMRLDDIDWRSGHLTVKGKTRRPDRLPLPQDVGDAILAYLAAARPEAAEEHLFLRTSTVSAIPLVRRDRGHRRSNARPRWDRRSADRVAHIPAFACHQPAARGRRPESVGTILRHSSPETTAIYAKVDLPMLMKIAQPWPGERHAEHAHFQIRRAASQLGTEVLRTGTMLRQYAAYAGGVGTHKSSASTTGATRRARKCGPP
jgi:site-specific recombinase XerC